MESQFKHDCDACQLVGQDAKHDFYFCARADTDMGGSVIARYGSDCPNYASAPVSIAKTLRERGWQHGERHVPGSDPEVQNSPVVTALRLTEEKGLLPKPPEPPAGAKTEPLPDYGDVMELADFVKNCEMGGFIDYDGSGYYAAKGLMYRDFPADPSAIVAGQIDRRFTHVAWFNK